jgi:hypothetical protein
MSLEQTIRDTVMLESMDLDARLQQLVRAGLMPSNTLPLLRKAIAKVQGGMSLQGPERDVMATFINSMMYIVLGDDTIFNKARAGAKNYATEEVELDENAKIVAHLVKRYGDNIRKSHVVSAANDFGVDASKLSKAVRKKLGKTMLEAKEKQEYDYEGDMAMSQLKSIIANSQRMHDMLGEDTNLPEWVQSKITLAEDYISTASNYMQGEMNEEQIDELSKSTLGSYVKKAKNQLSSSDYHVGRAVGAREVGQSANFSKELENKLAARGKKRYHGIDKAVGKMTKEEVQIDELSKKTMGSYVKKASGAERPKNVMDPKNVPLTNIAAYQGDSETGHFGKRFNQHTYDKAERLRKNRETGIKRAVDKLAKEEVEITEASVADVAKTAHLHVRAGKHDSIHTAIQSAVNTHFPSSVHSAVTRKKVAAQALNKIQSMNKSKLTKEESDQIDELSKPTIGRYINKAKNSIDLTAWRQGYKEAGAGSPSKHMEKKLSKRHKGIETAVKKLTKEESENLDELSKATMGRYINKAATKMGSQGVTAGLKIAADEKSSKNFKDMGKREKGIKRAVNKLTKEDIDAVKKMNESYKTAFDTALTEYGIKSPSELDESKRKEFFNYVDQEFKKGDK